MTIPYTPAALRWIRAHADKMNAADMAAHLGWQIGSLLRICGTHDVTLCEESDKHADLAPLPSTMDA